MGRGGILSLKFIFFCLSQSYINFDRIWYNLMLTKFNDFFYIDNIFGNVLKIFFLTILLFVIIL